MEWKKLCRITRKSRLTKIGRKTGIWKIGKKPISENTKNFEIKIFLWIEESITNNYRYIRSSYLEIDPILSEPDGMIISFITDGIHYYIKLWSQNFSPLPTFHRTYTKSSSILLITPKYLIYTIKWNNLPSILTSTIQSRKHKTTYIHTHFPHNINSKTTQKGYIMMLWEHHTTLSEMIE